MHPKPCGRTGLVEGPHTTVWSADSSAAAARNPRRKPLWSGPDSVGHMYGWISLTTDYGLSDGFVAACHGVIARLAPAVRVIDVTHLVTPGNVARGAAVLAQAVPHLPPAVHVAVVDPGVGTARRGLAVRARNG